MNDELKPCPMCGGPAEMDTLRGYRRWSDGSVGNAIAVYCTECTLEISVCRDDVPDIEPEQVAEMWNRRAQPAAPADAAPSVAPEPVAWEGGEGWESLAWELCADENGEDACNELIWEGGPIPEPWGDRWMKYEGEAKRLIALVHKHAAHPPRAPSVAPEPPRSAQLMICTGCGRQSDDEPIKTTALACCPDNRYRTLRELLSEIDTLRRTHPPRAPLTDEHVYAVVRSVQPHLATTSKAWRDLVVECRYWLEAAHGIGGK